MSVLKSTNREKYFFSCLTAQWWRSRRKFRWIFIATMNKHKHTLFQFTEYAHARVLNAAVRVREVWGMMWFSTLLRFFFCWKHRFIRVMTFSFAKVCIERTYCDRYYIERVNWYVTHTHTFDILDLLDCSMGARLARSDFQWVYNDEPHTTRRREMLRK